MWVCFPNIFAIVLIPVLIFFHAGRGMADQAALPEVPLAKKSLQREVDPIVVSGDLLPAFQGHLNSTFRLLAFQKNRMQVIPFQIDERNPEGEFVFTHGEDAGVDVDQGRFDDNDEIVFMSKDTGDKAPMETWTASGDCRAEIMITDPIDKSQKGWVYLVCFSQNPPPLSPRDYVTYVPGREIVFSDYYEMQYRKGSPFYMNLRCPKGAGGDGRDFLDRIKVRLSVDAFFNLVHIEKNEDDFRSVVMAWKDGPVRAMRKVENYFRILFNLSSPSIFSVNEYFERMTYTPVQLTIPFRLKWVFNTFAINDWTWTIYGDFPGLKGGMAYTDQNLNGFQFTGDHSRAYLDQHIETSRFSWGYNTKPGVGTWFPNLLLPEMLYGIASLYIVDDQSLADPPEDTPGLIGAGMIARWRDCPPELVNLLEPGTYELSLDTYFPHPSVQPQEVDQWLRIRRHPLLADIAAIDRPYGDPSMPDEKTPPPAEPNGFQATLTDTRGRTFTLSQLFFYAGSYRVTPRTQILGRDFRENHFQLLDFEDIRQITHRYESIDPISGMQHPMVQEIVLADDRTIELLGCKPCGFSGIRPNGRKVFLWDTQIQSLSFTDR